MPSVVGLRMVIDLLRQLLITAVAVILKLEHHEAESESQDPCPLKGWEGGMHQFDPYD